jgi:hypothetical protein
MKNVKDNVKTKKKPKVHQELGDFNMRITPLGEVKSSIDIDEIINFLDNNLIDKKISNRDED